MISMLIERIEAQTSGPIAINAQLDEGFETLNHPVLTDQLRGRPGPLAGLHAAMIWAETEGFESVITTPVDTPMIPEDFIATLVASGAPSIAKHGERKHPVHGIWPTKMHAKLKSAVDQGLRAAQNWVKECQAVNCEFDTRSGLDPFFNVNTPNDLEALNTTIRSVGHRLSISDSE